MADIFGLSNSCYYWPMKCDTNSEDSEDPGAFIVKGAGPRWLRQG